MDVSLYVLLVCQPLCFIGLHFNQPHSFRKIISEIILIFPHFHLIAGDMTFLFHGLCEFLACDLHHASKHFCALQNILMNCTKKAIYAINWKVLNRLIKSESLKGKKITEYYWCNLTLIIMDCEWIGKFFIISLNISWGLLGVGRPCNFAITEQKI